MSSLSSAVPSATSAAAAATSSAAATIHAPPQLKVVGIILAIVSGLLIGSSFVFKKKGLLRSQAGGELGEGVAYLKSPLWWIGMIMMIIGELCNFAAYAFVEAIVVTPLGALSVVICAILSSFFLNEKLSFFGWLGCGLCILGSTIIALNGPKEESVGQIRDFQKLFLAPGFLAFAGSFFVISLVIIFYFAPRYGKKNMLWYIAVCSMIGGISVSVTTGLGAAIVTTAYGDNQFKYWFTYFLAAFVIVTLITEVYYLNVALALFNTAMVTPTYYVIFTFCSMLTTVVLFKGLKASVTQILTLVLAFLTICVGITILQMSKIDPTQLKLDRRSTILLQAARSQTENADEKHLSGLEDPGMDALRGSFGTVGSIIRAKSVRRMSTRSSRGGDYGHRPPGAAAPFTTGLPFSRQSNTLDRDSSFAAGGLKRHQLYDAPMPSPVGNDANSLRAQSLYSLNSQSPLPHVAKRPTIKFDSQDVIHSYNRPGTGESQAYHEHRAAVGSPAPTVYPPLPPPKSPVYSTPSKLQSQSQQQQQSSPIPLEGKLLEIESPESDTPITNVAVLGDDSNLSTLASEVIVPPHMERGWVNEVHSAPPTMYARFKSPPLVAPQPKRKDSRNIFGLGTKDNDEHVNDPTNSTLLSFPSVTDSEGRSEQGWDDEELQRQKEQARATDRGRSSFTTNTTANTSHPRPHIISGRSHRKYPKGDGDDDREESVALFRRGTMSEEEVVSPQSGGEGAGGTRESVEDTFGGPPLMLRDGGIRLVSSPASNLKKGGVS